MLLDYRKARIAMDIAQIMGRSNQYRNIVGLPDRHIGVIFAADYANREDFDRLFSDNGYTQINTYADFDTALAGLTKAMTQPVLP